MTPRPRDLSQGPPRLLLLEDDPMLREMLCLVVEDFGFICDSRNSVEAARRALARASYALVIMDHDLIDGASTALLDDGLLDPTDVLMVSARSRQEIGRSLVHLQKPIDIDEFHDTLVAMTGVDPATLSPPRPSAPPLELILYVAQAYDDASPVEHRLREALKRFDGMTVDLQVINLAREPQRHDPEDRVLFTPTLIRRRPGPRLWMVGDLSETPRVEQFLIGSGLRPKAPA